jgi:hypothetical protein
MVPDTPPITVGTINGAWSVSFQSGRGAPASLTLSALKPLNESSDIGVRYFSGVSTYRTSFAVPRRFRQSQPLLLDLGKVGDIAEVRINGKAAGTVWAAPYRLDISRLVKRGTNQLEVHVANLWVNRLVGDAQPGAKKIAWTSTPMYRADAPLRPSGLIGPVSLLAIPASVGGTGRAFDHK